MISEVCEAFQCLPDEAARQDWTMVQQILEYRSVKQALAQFRSGRKGFEQMAQNKHGAALLLEMLRANADVDGVTMDTVFDVLTENLGKPVTDEPTELRGMQGLGGG